MTGPPKRGAEVTESDCCTYELYFGMPPKRAGCWLVDCVAVELPLKLSCKFIPLNGVFDCPKLIKVIAVLGVVTVDIGLEPKRLLMG